MSTRKKKRIQTVCNSRKKSLPRSKGQRRKTYKKVGGRHTRAALRAICDRILSHCPGCTAAKAAERLGLVTHDINNLKAGNRASLDIVIKMINKGGFSPESIIHGPGLRKMSAAARRKAVRKRLISARIRQLARSRPAQVWSKATELSIHSVYQLRISGSRAGIHAVLGFVHAGVPVQKLFFGE